MRNILKKGNSPLLFGVVLAALIGLSLAGCGGPNNPGGVAVPSWAQGDWYTSSPRVRVLTITSTQLIAYDYTGNSEAGRTNCTSVDGNIVTFETGDRVREGNSPGTISWGLSGTSYWTPLYN